MCVCVCVCVCIHTYVLTLYTFFRNVLYIYIQRKAKRLYISTLYESSTSRAKVCKVLRMSFHRIYIYIYIYTLKFPVSYIYQV